MSLRIVLKLYKLLYNSSINIFKFKTSLTLTTCLTAIKYTFQVASQSRSSSTKRFVSLLYLTLKLRVARHIECVELMSVVTPSGWSTAPPVLWRVWQTVRGVCVVPARRRTCGGCCCCCSCGRSAAGWGMVGTAEAVGRNCHCYGDYCSYLIRKNTKYNINAVEFNLNLIHSNATLF